jgi:hypothetical protein
MAPPVSSNAGRWRWALELNLMTPPELVVPWAETSTGATVSARVSRLSACRK